MKIIKRLLKITYWVNFKQGNVIAHSISSFWFWEAPVFYNWVIEQKTNLDKQHNLNLTILNCGKI